MTWFAATVMAMLSVVGFSMVAMGAHCPRTTKYASIALAISAFLMLMSGYAYATGASQ